MIHKCTWAGCDKGFTSSGNLKTHTYTHTGEQPYKCTWAGCDKGFTSSGNLKTHTYTHTGEQPYKCTWAGCDYASKSASHLKTHTYTHTGEQPYKCTWAGCDKGFTQSGNLKTHQKNNHVGEECLTCGRVFLQGEIKGGHQCVGKEEEEESDNTFASPSMPFKKKQRMK